MVSLGLLTSNKSAKPTDLQIWCATHMVNAGSQQEGSKPTPYQPPPGPPAPPAPQPDRQQSGYNPPPFPAVSGDAWCMYEHPVSEIDIMQGRDGAGQLAARIIPSFAAELGVWVWDLGRSTLYHQLPNPVTHMSNSRLQ